MTDYPHLLEAWEGMVRDEPRLAFQFGPPNWLMAERKRKGETFLEAAHRVKAEYFPAGTVTTAVTSSPVTTNMVTGNKVCEDCGKVIQNRTLCGACRVRRTRAKK